MTRFRKLYPPGDHLTFFEVPMLGAGARLGRWFIDSGMRRGPQHTPAQRARKCDHRYGGTGDWKTRLRVVNDKLAYLVLLDPEGRVRWLHAGMLDEARSRGSGPRSIRCWRRLGNRVHLA
jgi:hypothetical protein